MQTWSQHSVFQTKHQNGGKVIQVTVERLLALIAWDFHTAL